MKTVALILALCPLCLADAGYMWGYEDILPLEGWQSFYEPIAKAPLPDGVMDYAFDKILMSDISAGLPPFVLYDLETGLVEPFNHPVIDELESDTEFFVGVQGLCYSENGYDLWLSCYCRDLENMRAFFLFYITEDERYDMGSYRGPLEEGGGFLFKYEDGAVNAYENGTPTYSIKVDDREKVRDLAWDGKNIWAATGRFIYRLNLEEEGVDAWLPAPFGVSRSERDDTRLYFVFDGAMGLTSNWSPGLAGTYTGGDTLYVSTVGTLWMLDPTAACEEPPPVGTALCMTEGLHLYDGPGTDHDVIDAVCLYEPVYILERQGDWWRVFTEEGESGWVSSSEGGPSSLVEGYAFYLQDGRLYYVYGKDGPMLIEEDED